MTIKEIAEVAGVSAETVRSKGKELYPDRIINGIKTVFSREQSIKIMSELRVKGAIMPTENLPQNMEVVTRSDLAAFGTAIVAEMMKQFLPLIQNQTKQFEFIQDYYSIKGYASKLGQQINFSDALNLGRIAGRLSREKNIEIRKVDDESFGRVNSYNIEILKEVFQI